MGIFKTLLEDEKLIREIRTYIVIAISLGLGFLYFGFFGQIDIEALLQFKSIGLGLVSFISLTMVRLDIKDRAFKEECEENEDIAST